MRVRGGRAMGLVLWWGMMIEVELLDEGYMDQ